MRVNLWCSYALLALSMGLGCSSKASNDQSPEQAVDEGERAGGCAESQNGYIRCTFYELESASALEPFRNGCEARDDGYHQFDWFDACPPGSIVGCRFNDTGIVEGTVTEYVYFEHECRSSQTEVPPAG